MMPPEDVAHWEPLENDRAYQRHLTSGQLGWVVKREGKLFVRLDRPQEEILIPYSENTWKVEERAMALNPQQCATVAYAAHKALCALTGKHEQARAEWANMAEENRIRWSKDGPRKATELEWKLFSNIMGILKKYS